MNQDALGKGGKVVLKRDEVQVWMKPLEDGSTALAVINLNWTPVNFTFTLKECGLPDGLSARDLWKQKPAGSQLKAMNVKLGGHGSAMYKLSLPKR